MSWSNLVRHLPALWQDERTRTQFLGGMGMLATIGGAVATYAFLREPLHVSLDHLTVHLSNAKGKLPEKGLRLLHLSDTHFQGKEWREQAKISSIRKACAGLDYDLLIHTGDFWHHDGGLPNVLRLLDVLPAPRLGGYAVFGNHDYCTYSHDHFLQRSWAKFQEVQCTIPPVADPVRANGSSPHGGDGDGYTGHRFPGNGYNQNGYNGNGVAQHGTRSRLTPIDQARTLYKFSQFCANAPFDFKRIGRNNCGALEAALAARNIQTLHNRFARLTHTDAGIDLYIAGVDDVQEGTPELPRALSEIPHDAPTILLSHNPDILVEPGVEQVDLVLSGHTHGGQIVLPLLGAAHTQTAHLPRKEVSGYLRRGKTQVYITRGIGEGIPFRLGAAPQITLITLLPE